MSLQKGKNADAHLQTVWLMQQCLNKKSFATKKAKDVLCGVLSDLGNFFIWDYKKNLLV